MPGFQIRKLAQVLRELIIDYGCENGINEHITDQYSVSTFCGLGLVPGCTFIEGASGYHGVATKNENRKGEMQKLGQVYSEKSKHLG